MTKRLIVAVLMAVVAVSALLAVWLAWGREGATRAQGETVEMGIDPEVTGNTATSLGTLEDCVRVDVPSPAFDGLSDYDIDVYVQGDTQAPTAYDAWVTYDATKVHIAAPGTSTLIKLPAGSNFSDGLPDSDGMFVASAVYFSGGPGIGGDGALVRLGLDIGGSGLLSFDFNAISPATGYASLAGNHPVTRRTAQLAINEDCPRSQQGAEPSATPAQVAMPTPILPVDAEWEAEWEKFDQSVEADRAKPRFRGELGDFVVVDPNTGTNYPCPERYQPGTNPEQSELHFDLPGAVIDMVGSCQGTVISITASVSDGEGGALVGRVYFVGPKMRVSFDAPAERVKPIAVAGKPALAMLPIPDCIACLTEVVAIERFPSGTAPGITAWAHTDHLDKAIALVEQIMAGKQ